MRETTKVTRISNTYKSLPNLWGVELIFVEDRIAEKRGLNAQGRKLFTIEDAVPSEALQWRVCSIGLEVPRGLQEDLGAAGVRPTDTRGGTACRRTDAKNLEPGGSAGARN